MSADGVDSLYKQRIFVWIIDAFPNDTRTGMYGVKKNIAALEPWGDFRWDNFRALEREGYAPTFYVCSSKLFKQEWADKYFATPISEQGGKTYFVTFSAEHPDITAEALVLPDRTLSDYLAEESRLEAEIERVHNQMLAVNEQYRGVLTAGRIDNENAISLSKVHLSHESIAGDAVRLLVGWTLAEKVDPVVNYLEDNHIYYELADPSFDDNVPIQIQNNKFASLFEPILRMYSLPNYHDIDPLPLFAPFFMLFFGLCMGDAGYGTLILAASIAICLLKPNIRKYGLLGACLGGMTIVCGLITGTFFGIDLSTVDWDWIKPLQPYFLNDSKKDSFFGYSPMMVISVIIGLIQVLIGMTMAGCKAVKNYGWVFGWHRHILVGYSPRERHHPVRSASVRRRTVAGGSVRALRPYRAFGARHFLPQQPCGIPEAGRGCRHEHRLGPVGHLWHGNGSARRPAELHPSVRTRPHGRRIGQCVQFACHRHDVVARVGHPMAAAHPDSALRPRHQLRAVHDFVICTSDATHVRRVFQECRV